MLVQDVEKQLCEHTRSNRIGPLFMKLKNDDEVMTALSYIAAQLRQAAPHAPLPLNIPMILEIICTSRNASLSADRLVRVRQGEPERLNAELYCLLYQNTDLLGQLHITNMPDAGLVLLFVDIALIQYDNICYVRKVNKGVCDDVSSSNNAVPCRNG